MQCLQTSTMREVPAEGSVAKAWRKLAMVMYITIMSSNESSFSPALPALIPIPTVNFHPAFWQGHCFVGLLLQAGTAPGLVLHGWLKALCAASYLKSLSHSWSRVFTGVQARSLKDTSFPKDETGTVLLWQHLEIVLDPLIVQWTFWGYNCTLHITLFRWFLKEFCWNPGGAWCLWGHRLVC